MGILDIMTISIYCLHTKGIIWYIGSTKNISQRLHAHKTKKDPSIRYDLIPEGIKYRCTILEIVEEENRLEREFFWIKECCPVINQTGNPNGFLMTFKNSRIQ